MTSESKIETYPITVTVNLTKAFLAAMLCNAVEGGCSYWATGRNVKRDENGEYLSIELRDSEDDESEWKLVDYAAIAKGCQMIVSDGEHNDSLVSAIINCDECQPDVNDADMMVQYGIFGEIVYN